ncbi:recombinase family protein [Rhodococcus sp. IEGM 1366]|uniref:recombinase family protein n=1 Tax=Rhodococcus sp. IEGM 1366 TaxID=3082223 RepID=UPI0029531CDD|nr:recombinase family protein [Rhodococcus sp. IEGM 1366]MDV8070644.1 recombinase family protein [Rhodococcus sp. IEGM 1366]
MKTNEDDKIEPQTGDLYPDPDGGGSADPTKIWDGDGGVGPTTIWDDHGGGGTPTSTGVDFMASTLVGPGLRAGGLQISANTFSFYAIPTNRMQFAGTDRPRPALTAALSALSARDTLVVTTLDRLARSVADLGEITTDHAARDVVLMFDGTVHDPRDPIGRTVFEMLSMTFTDFESGLNRLRTMEGNARRKAAGGFTCPQTTP